VKRAVGVVTNPPKGYFGSMMKEPYWRKTDFTRTRDGKRWLIVEWKERGFIGLDEDMLPRFVEWDQLPRAFAAYFRGRHASTP
jgi:hypothetical protein